MQSGVNPGRRPIAFDERKIDTIFAELNQCHLPGAAVGIAIHGRPVYRKGFGLANLELPVVLSPTTRMRIASVSKHFASLAFMLLCEEGKARPDDHVGVHIPELHTVTRDVTMRQLMGNIGGLRDSHDVSCQFGGSTRPVSSLELLSFYRTMGDVNAAPGATWIYNNGGFLILSTAIERICGQTLEDVLRERIFEPVGMYSTQLRRWDTDFVSDSAVAHMTTDSGGYTRSNFWGMAWAGEGGIVSTIDDMLRWLAHMDSPVVGSDQTWATMRSPQILANGTSTGYGLGLVCGQYRGAHAVYHLGGGMGCSAYMVKIPAAGLDVVVMANREDAQAASLGEQILDACLPDLDPVEPTDAHRLQTGVFRSRVSGRVLELRVSPFEVRPWIKKGQPVACIDGRDIPVAADKDGVLRPTGSWRHFKLSIAFFAERADPPGIRISDFGNVDDLQLVRTECRPDDETILGSYRSSITDIQATITAVRSGPQLCTFTRFGTATFELQCLADRIWRAKPTGPIPWGGGVLVFDDEGTGFRFWSNRTRALIFQRNA
ncbi:MAG TPA: serine hydrolase domain-containing protein [Povalibacter sp.]|nr:serine hydrolase domain-containing protein [Povalibacter sp.]